MAIFPGGKSTRVDSPRHLTIRHSRRVIAIRKRESRLPRVAAAGEVAKEGNVSESEEEIDPLQPGEEKLNSYWAPGLEAGPKHIITVTQTVDAHTGSPLVLEAERDFYVDAPQFSLPDGSVHSTYPPAGYSDDHRILPHIVLTDPHLPWERLGSPSAGTNAELKNHFRMMAAGHDVQAVRNRVPWLVIFSFSQDELRLPPEDLDTIFKPTSSGVIKPVKQSSTMTVNMSIADLWTLDKNVVATPVTPNLGPDTMKDSRGDFIFVNPDLFKSLFSTFDDDGKRVESTNPNTTQYQYLSHVRKVNGSGMALAGVEDTAVFSIVVGNRSGPLDNLTPTTACVHLVSIEGVEDMKFPTGSQRYVALCSLYSWNYTVLPANTLNVPDAFEHLGRTLDVLRAPEKIIAPLRSSDQKIKQRVARRLDDGYTLVKYRTQTGEATVALYRGPFTPTYVSKENNPKMENLDICSNSGVDLQIIDKELGIMDITYSVAWQTGRTMALGDETFTAALVRLRSSIHKTASAEAKLQTIKDIDDAAIRTRGEVLSGLSNVVNSLATIHLGDGGDPSAPPQRPNMPSFERGGAKKRWFRPRLPRADIPNLSFTSPLIEDKYPKTARNAARSLAGSTGGGLFDETNAPMSTDWMIVLSWLVDRMFLAGVPAHCLLPDATYLETESLRFFRIDEYWVDALIDGALSLGNHFGDDLDRVAIKKALNDYIKHTPAGLDHPMQIPSYGFYLRSDLVTMFPDLRVEVREDGDAIRAAGQDPPGGAPLLRHEIVTDGVMMAFMDRQPGQPEFSSLVFTQPAHQQRFAVARGIGTDEIKINIRRQYTVDQTTRETDKKRHDALKEYIYHPKGDQSTDNPFIWDSQPGSGLNDLRILRLPRFADLQLSTLQELMPTYQEGGEMKKYFDDNASTSALFAMQLNDPIYSLTIDLKPHPPSTSLASLGPPGGTSGPEFRTLKRLGTARVKRLTHENHKDDATSPAKVQSELVSDDDEAATFQRHENYAPSTHALSKHLAPNVRSLTAFPDTREAISALAEIRGPANPPEYDIRVGSNVPGKWSSITLGDPNLEQDLIFSVWLRNDSNQYKLVELDIEIKLGPAPKSATEDYKYIMQNYTGPGAHMLTNLRFNILPAMVENSNEPSLRLRLLPRAAKGWIDVTQVRELSFLLGLAKVNAPKVSVAQLEITSWAFYCRDNQNPKVGPDDVIRIDNRNTLVTVRNPKP